MGRILRRAALALLIPLSLCLDSFPSLAKGLTLAPEVGHPLTGFAAKGTGFGPNEPVDVFFDATDLRLADADTAGNVDRVDMVVPAEALPGTHWITAIGRTTGNASRTEFTVRTDWSQFGWNPHGRRYNRDENVINAGNVSRLQKLWLASTGSVPSSPVMADGTVYVTSKNGLLAVDQTTGSTKWLSVMGASSQAPTVVNNRAFTWALLGGHYETEQAFDTATGALSWSTNLGGGGVYFPPATTKDVLYVPGDLIVDALDPSTGTILWAASSYAADANATPTVADGVVYVSSVSDRDSAISALDAKTGKAIWKTLAGYLVSSPIVVKNTLYAISGAVGRGSEMYALNAKTGSVIWSVGLPTSLFFNPMASANGVLYVNASDGHVYAYSAGNGRLIWTSASIGNISSAPAIANGVVYVSATSIYALDALTGSTLWSSPASGGTFSAPVVADGLVVASSTDGNIYAYALDGGKSAVYHRSAAPPDYSSLHPNQNLKASSVLHLTGAHH